MLLADVNVLVHAFRPEAADHREHRRWLEGVAGGGEPFGISTHVLSSFIRVVTNPRIFRVPDPLERALDFAEALRAQPNAVAIAPGERHWGIFTGLLRSAEASGNLVPDAWLAALAIEHGCQLVSNDRDFARFHGLRWSRPLPRPSADPA